MSDQGETGEYLQEWHRFVDGQTALRTEANERLARIKIELKSARKELGITENARDLLIAATAATQDQVKEFIEELVSLALQSVFGIEYYFVLEAKERRGQAELEPIILWRQERLSPRGETGGGVVDVASFALRLVLWALSAKRSSPVFILDEPFKFLSKDKTEAAAAMLKSVADLLGCQIIMVSHDEGLAIIADRSWTVTRGGSGKAVVAVNQ